MNTKDRNQKIRERWSELRYEKEGNECPKCKGSGIVPKEKTSGWDTIKQISNELNLDLRYNTLLQIIYNKKK